MVAVCRTLGLLGPSDPFIQVLKKKKEEREFKERAGCVLWPPICETLER